MADDLLIDVAGVSKRFCRSLRRSLRCATTDLFRELGTGVRTYSSGMAARLGFACAVHTNPDVLLIDEVLAVGDMAFRAKCYRKLAELRKGGTGFILDSHSSQMVTSVCDAAVYLEGG